MIILYGLLFLSILVFSAGVLYGIYWAARSGQFTRFQEGAQSIFDKDEPIGQITDVFPKRKNGKR